MKKILIFGLILMFITSLCGQINYDTLYQTSAYDENKNTFGVSLHAGYYKMKADVEGNGLGYGLNIHAPVNSTLSLRLGVFMSTAQGLSLQPWSSYNFGGGLVENVYLPYSAEEEGWFPSYKFSQRTLEIEGILNLTRLISKQLDIDFNVVDLYILGGYGFFTHKTQLDLLDANNMIYTDLVTNSNWTFDKFNSSEGRKQIESKLKEIYDGKYETEKLFAKRNKVYSYGGGIKFNPAPYFGLGMEYKIIIYHDFDYADGLRFRNSDQLTQNNDSATYFNLFLEYKF